MALDTLALVASGLIALAEGFSATQSRIRLAQVLFFTAMVLLLAGFRRTYFIAAAALLVSAGGCAVLIHTWRVTSKGSNNLDFPHNQNKIALFISRLLAAAVHIIGVWWLPFFAVWGFSDAYSDANGNFFKQEVGHLAPASFYYIFLVILPLFFLPPGYQTGSLTHQRLEATATCISATIYFIIFRTAHYFQGQSPPNYMEAANYDHELLGLVWMGSGAAGMVTALIGYKTSIHIVFPAAFVCLSMMAHNHHADEEYSGTDDDYEPEGPQGPWAMSYMRFHYLHGLSFGAVALCRLLYRIPEAVFFSFLGSIIFVFSAVDVMHPFHDAFDWNIPPGATRPDCPACRKGYPTTNVVTAVVVTFATIWFPVHLVSLSQLRKCVEQRCSSTATFSALSTEEPSNDLAFDETLDLELTASDETGQSDVNGGGLVQNANR